MGLMPKEVGPAYPNSGFLPATDGGTPACVQDPRDTFCLDPKKYPKERILYLLENKMFDVDSMLMDESRDSYIFESRNSPPVSMYDYDPLRQTYEPPRQTYEQPHQTYKPPRPSYGPPPSPPSLPSNGYLPPRQNNFSTTSKPYHHPSSPLSPPAKYAPPHHTPSGHTYGAAPYHYGTPAPSFDNEGPYPRYRKATTPSSSYLTRVMRSSRRRHKRQLSSMELCAYEEDYIMPRAALNNKGTWMFLVNMEEESPQYTQAVQTKKCIPGATSCSGACNIPNGFTATCQQQYVQKRLIALDGSGSTLATDLFWFPSCCLCKIVPDG
ncbi:Protein spaetzle 5 [Chionoecetes opilio]|uniref:Protein spaetzle 5 n=1 Tax=Chionoecetes opilio TaxID=41210 RepID=A0A8J5CGQ4_CHIOP|nr:Protein spaetzle 5 [Chionoecetes opilio]